MIGRWASQCMVDSNAQTGKPPVSATVFTNMLSDGYWVTQQCVIWQVCSNIWTWEPLFDVSSILCSKGLRFIQQVNKCLANEFDSSKAAVLRHRWKHAERR